MAGKQKEALRLENGQQIRYDTIKVRIYPTEEQKTLFEKTFGCCRYIWNRMLADQQEFYCATDKHFIPTPAKYKKEAPFLAEVDNQALIQEHNKLSQAFRVFFKSPDHFGYPRFKRKKDDRDSFSACNCFSPSGSTIYITREGIRMTKAGIVKAKFHRRPQSGWVLKRITVEKTRGGHYFCALLYAHVVQTPAPVRPTPEGTVGLKYSMRHFYVADTGDVADPPCWMQESQKKLRKVQRRLCRMQPGSRNYQEEVKRYQLLHEHIANQRRDYIHQESRRIANAWDAVCMRADDLTELSQQVKRGRVQDSGFGMFREILRDKLERQGKSLILVDRYYPSSRICHQCGCLLDSGVDLRKSVWTCPACGAVLDREVNAAQNIKAAGLAQSQDPEKVA